MTIPERPLTILVVDDDPQIQRVMRSILSVRHYHVLQAFDGQQALEMIAEHAPGLVVLDLMMPGMSGLEVCKEARAWYTGPILILSARGGDRDKIEALDLGADDYLTKPFSTGELLARVRALLRRVMVPRASRPQIDIGDLHIDLPRRQVTRLEGPRPRGPLPLTPIEYDLLVYLAQNANCVVTSRQLVQQVWGNEEACDAQTLRSHISHLRHKIEPDPTVPQYLLTEPGVGFRLTEAEE